MGNTEYPLSLIHIWVTVSVIKILEQNIGQFLQSNNLDESGELMRVGRLIARKTIFLDEAITSLPRQNTTPYFRNSRIFFSAALTDFCTA